ncbi:SDR family NAD(P)-dependent oxidoreductase [Rhodococcus globerulus]|uniref:SDR family NAD(P)-dependent oxidoreductase n=1 Tax=Rhodococcus globerulus TaxID=33008 RepID=UPI001C5644C5|nr:SDR family NAD(P)-dependent oxidoreductase [Rhodococcus globerulus]QXW01322.1 SDR family oxidoreductase [Rhodococcus globerulus]
MSSRNSTPRVAIVTGAGSGIGAAVAAKLADDGYRVVAADVNQAAVENLTAELAERGHSVFCAEVDVASPESVAALLHRASTWAANPITTLVNCAGVNSHHDVLDLPFEEWERVIRTNLTGTFLVSQLVAKLMVENGRGTIVNISSVNAELTSGNGAHYAASKGGVRQLTKAFAVGLAPYNIRVNAVGPGPVETNLTAHRIADPEIRQNMMRGVLRGRFGQPDDIASAVAFLASDDSDYITGTTLYIDGGILACR